MPDGLFLLLKPMKTLLLKRQKCDFQTWRLLSLHRLVDRDDTFNVTPNIFELGVVFLKEYLVSLSLEKLP